MTKSLLEWRLWPSPTEERSRNTVISAMRAGTAHAPFKDVTPQTKQSIIDALVATVRELQAAVKELTMSRYADPGTTRDYTDGLAPDAELPENFGEPEHRDPAQDAANEVLNALSAFGRELERAKERQDFERAMTLWDLSRELLKAVMVVNETAGDVAGQLVERRR